MTATLKRWLEMSQLGATVPREALDRTLAGTARGQERVPVRTLAQANAFFRGVAYAHTPRTPIPVESPSHAWLLWLIQGHYNYSELCPLGVDHFFVHLNSDLGYPGNHRGFSLVATGAGGRSREFGYEQALKGVPKNMAEKVRVAFRKAVDYQVAHWIDQNFRDGLVCPVFGTPLRRGDVQADHDPTFVQLVDAFCAAGFVPFEEITVEDVWTGCAYTWSLSEPLLSQWRQSHWQHMRLRLLSTAGHLELGRQRHEAEKAAELKVLEQKAAARTAANRTFGGLRS